ncbi:MAG: monovalent cation/H+ antiporter complex subunit F [Lachnospiraceae bacterium]|nr:monovalent cation/H+ antiporter complex subunit F [Lachnospiraceae bacterium]
MYSTILGYVYLGLLVVLAVFVFFCLVRAALGPTVADRIVAVNMMGTMVIVAIAVLSLMLHQGFLLDVSLIYAMISFLAVIVITRIYIREYEIKKSGEVEE